MNSPVKIIPLEPKKIIKRADGKASMTGPIERKVQASTAAAAVSGLILWGLGTYLFKGTVPDVVTSWVYALVPAGITFAAGYITRHTPRPVPAPSPPGLVEQFSDPSLTGTDAKPTAP